MHNPLRHQLLDQVLEVISLCRPLVLCISRHDRELSAQVRRALNSVALNVAEGCGPSTADNARLRFESARGSLQECQAGLRSGIAWGLVSAGQCAPALQLMDKLGGRIYGLSKR